MIKVNTKASNRDRLSKKLLFLRKLVFILFKLSQNLTPPWTTVLGYALRDGIIRFQNGAR